VGAPHRGRGWCVVGEEEEISRLVKLLSRYLVYLRNPFSQYEKIPKDTLLRMRDKAELVKRVEYRSGENNCISGSIELYHYADRSADFWIMKLEEVGMDECGAWGEIAIAIIPQNELTL